MSSPLCALGGGMDKEVRGYLALYFRSQLQSTALLLRWRTEPVKLLEAVLFWVNKEHFYLKSKVWPLGGAVGAQVQVPSVQSPRQCPESLP